MTGPGPSAGAQRAPGRRFRPDAAGVEPAVRTTRPSIRTSASLRLDRTDDDDEPLYVLADPAGHPFFLLVAGH